MEGVGGMGGQDGAEEGLGDKGGAWVLVKNEGVRRSVCVCVCE